jgi:hypothetical protein
MRALGLQYILVFLSAGAGFEDDTIGRSAAHQVLVCDCETVAALPITHSTNHACMAVIVMRAHFLGAISSYFPSPSSRELLSLF